jgi:hypothetical protein
MSEIEKNENQEDGNGVEKEMVIDSNNENTNKRTLIEGVVNGSVVGDDYDDYYNDLDECIDDNRRAHHDAKFRQQLYLNMPVEEKNDARWDAHITPWAKVKREGKWNPDLEIIANEDEERHVAARKRARHTHHKLYDSKHKMKIAKKAIDKEWENVQYQCKAERKNYISCRKVAKKECTTCKKP